MEYDGHGRLWKRTTPEQGLTEYAYNADDTLQSDRDARGAKTTFGYDKRHLVTSLAYDTSQSPGVAQTPGANFEYDAAGNRTLMTDGLGSVTYHYDTLSRMEWEERHFNNVGTYRLDYGYNLAGQLTSMQNPWQSVVTYGRDVAGQVTQVTGAGQWSAASYAHAIQYRAWGGLKQMGYGNGRTLSVSYDTRRRVKQWDIPQVQGWEYLYATFYPENTGRVMYARNLYDATLDRSYDYDHVGRLTYSYTGVNARAHAGLPGGSWGYSDGPYAQAYHYDAAGNLTLREGWGGWNPSVSYSYTNNRRDNFSYDAAGNLTADGSTLTYDATSQMVSAVLTGYWNLQHAYDGDPLRVRKVEDGQTTYYLRSSVLGGQVVAEINASGEWQKGLVYAGRATARRAGGWRSPLAARRPHHEDQEGDGRIWRR